MIGAQKLTKKFGKKQALQELSFSFGEGIYGLVGPNGAGKTTFLRCLIGVYPPTAGRVLYNGAPVGRKNDVTRHLGYLPQKFGIYPELTVWEAMEYLCVIKGVPKAARKKQIEQKLEQVNLLARRDSRVGALSGGMVRRLGLAGALVGDSPLLILDEPTAGLDPEERMRFKNIIRSLGGERTVILSTHIMEDVEALCQQIVIVNQGRVIAAGSPKEIASLADGMTYEIPEGETVPEKAVVSKITEHDGQRFCRVVTTAPCSGTPVLPTVEDGYIGAVEGIVHVEKTGLLL